MVFVGPSPFEQKGATGSSITRARSTAVPAKSARRGSPTWCATPWRAGAPWRRTRHSSVSSDWSGYETTCLLDRARCPPRRRGPRPGADAGRRRNAGIRPWSSQIFTTSERPSFSLTFTNLDHLDFRVYRVADPLAFFAGLKDPHQLGSEKPVVPQERTWLERIADWKAGRRAAIQSFLRAPGQPTATGSQRREQQDKAKVVQRKTVNVQLVRAGAAAQRGQLVASWREILPLVRDAESRRIPLEVKRPASTWSRPSARRTRRTRSSSCRTSASSPRRRPARCWSTPPTA